MSRALALLALAGGVGCGVPPTLAPPGSSGPDTATSLDEAPFQEQLFFGPDGFTATLRIPALDDAEAVAVWARVSQDACFSIEELRDAAEEPAPPIAAARGAALLSLVPERGFVPSRGLSLRFRLRDCATTGSARPTSPLAIEVGWSPRAQVPERGSLALRFVVSSHSLLFGRPDLRGALMEHLAGELDQAGLEVSLEEVVELGDGVPEEVSAWSLEPGALAGIRALAPPPPRATVDVVFVGCVLYDDPLPGAVEVDGFTPRITGGGGAPADAIYLPGRRCDTLGAAPEAWRLDRYAHVLAHELGHFLGLDHAVEADGRADTLDDTGSDNIMHFNPGLSGARGFSPMQAYRLRAHPWVAAHR